MTSSADEIKKAFGLPSGDSSHTYVYKSGEFGNMYQYWWRDSMGNYYRYSNAEEGVPDFDPLLGAPLMDPEQPLPEKTPAFFTEEGYKRTMAVPEGVTATRNEAYNQNDSKNIWFEVFDKSGPRYVYLDADVKENLDLYIQQQLRVCDGALPKFRAYSAELFAGQHPKDRLTGGLLILCDQGYYEPAELLSATVGDVEFIDQAVVLLGRKFVCDLMFLDFITSIVAGRAPTEPLFELDTMHGTNPVGLSYLNSVFYSTRVSPKFLLCWNASHLYSRIVNRMVFQQIPKAEVEAAAFDELSRTLSTRDDSRWLVDYKVRVALMANYEDAEDPQDEVAPEPPDVKKSLSRLMVDDFGVAVIRSDLTSFREDEKEFSDWLRKEPLHDTTPAEEAAVETELASQKAEAAPPTEPTEQPSAEGAGPTDDKPATEDGAAPE